MRQRWPVVSPRGRGACAAPGAAGQRGRRRLSSFPRSHSIPAGSFRQALQRCPGPVQRSAGAELRPGLRQRRPSAHSCPSCCGASSEAAGQRSPIEHLAPVTRSGLLSRAICRGVSLSSNRLAAEGIACSRHFTRLPGGRSASFFCGSCQLGPPASELAGREPVQGRSAAIRSAGELGRGPLCEAALAPGCRAADLPGTLGAWSPACS